MNIQILNNDLSLSTIVSGCEKIEFARAFNTQGSFKIVINANNANAKYLSADKIVYIDAHKIGYIDKITSDKKTDKSGQYLTVEGVELKDRLNRVIYPDSSLVNDSYTNEKLETVVKSLINKNAGSLASGARQIPNLVTAADLARGLAVDYSARYKDLSQELYTLLMSQEMGLKATIDFDNTNIVFDVAVGNDKTATAGQAGGIVLSLDSKTALEIVDTDDRLVLKNLSVTAGLGEDENRTIQEVYTQTLEPAGYNRREVFTDARDIKSDDELPTRGAQKLGETQKARAISVKANALGSYKIGDDYDLGDYISVDAAGELFDSQIIKIKYMYDKADIPEIYLVLNCDVDDSLHSAITAKHMNYDALLSKDAKGYVNPASICDFYVYLSQDVSKASGRSTIPYNTKRRDKGNDFDTVNNCFTAPVDGLYLFFHEITVVSPTASRYSPEVYVDTTRDIGNAAYMPSEAYGSTMIAGPVVLAKDDIVYPKAYFENTKTISSSASLTYFAGVLLRDDS